MKGVTRTLRIGEGLVVAFVLLMAGPALAQDPTEVCAEGAEVDLAPGPIPGKAFHSVELFVAETGAERTLRLVDPESERSHLLRLPAGVPLTAQAKRDFGGRRKLDFADLRAGQRLRLTFRTAGQELIAVRVLRGDGL